MALYLDEEIGNSYIHYIMVCSMLQIFSCALKAGRGKQTLRDCGMEFQSPGDITLNDQPSAETSLFLMTTREDHHREALYSVL